MIELFKAKMNDHTTPFAFYKGKRKKPSLKKVTRKGVTIP
jgi:hypothetical protein